MKTVHLLVFQLKYSMKHTLKGGLMSWEGVIKLHCMSDSIDCLLLSVKYIPL